MRRGTHADLSFADGGPNQAWRIGPRIMPRIRWLGMERSALAGAGRPRGAGIGQRVMFGAVVLHGLRQPSERARGGRRGGNGAYEEQDGAFILNKGWNQTLNLANSPIGALLAVSCTGQICVAVGGMNGSTWQEAPVANAGRGWRLPSTSCSGNMCLAVG